MKREDWPKIEDDEHTRHFQDAEREALVAAEADREVIEEVGREFRLENEVREAHDKLAEAHDRLAEAKGRLQAERRTEQQEANRVAMLRERVDTLVDELRDEGA